ncbi:RNA-binding protein NOB1 [Cephus cinctus]|uniref:RNA-binding protein NOB1 n=1 Tax=Cephus cinctus TaxID=211228 RepID=A0AAJ7C7M9_CEPCN|nr:RNA-binding protein NOB1 [Cephus cinctus]
MGINNKVEYLVVDTSAFIKNVPLQEIGTNIITEQDVVNEITNKRQLRRLVVLPYDLSVKDVFPENIQFVTEFSKKTGDYTSLSATDIKVIALTYQLEKEKVGISHLKQTPTIVKTISTSNAGPQDHPKVLAGFYSPENDTESDEGNDNSEADNEEDFEEDSHKEESKSENPDVSLRAQFGDTSRDSSPTNSISAASSESDYETAASDLEEYNSNNLAAKFATLNCKPEDLKVEGDGEHNMDDILVPVKSENDDQDEEDEDDENEEEEDADDEGNDEDVGGWITPKNIVKVKKEMDSDVLEDKPATVACMTTDFAMQNVLMQIGLNVAALDGRVIKQMRTFILRCYACFKTTSVMTKMFCPNCGHKTLKKVAVSMDDNGKMQIHVNARKPLSARGKKFSLPTPKGGKHANNPILCEDQPMPDQRPTRLARTKNDPLNDDYIAGYSPFVMRDTNSKSAMLGIRPGSHVKHWMRKNPNEARRRRK